MGVLVPRHGEQAEAGEQVLAGIMLAWEQWPEDRRPLLIVKDSGGSGASTAMAYEELVKDGAVVVLGPVSTEDALAAAAVARMRRVPFVTPSATGDEVTRDNPFALRFCYTDEEAARAMALFARYELQLTRVALAVELDSRSSLAQGEAFGREFQVRRGRLAGEVGYYRGELDLGWVLDEVAALGVEGVFIPGRHDDVLAMVRQARDPRASRLALLGSDGWKGEALPAALAGRPGRAFALGHFSPEEARPDVEVFVSRFASLHDEPPGDLAALGFDTARAVFGIFDGTSDGDGMRRRLHEMAPLGGVTGLVRLDAGGSPDAKSMLLEQLHDPSAPRLVRRIEH